MGGGGVREVADGERELGEGGGEGEGGLLGVAERGGRGGVGEEEGGLAVRGDVEDLEG